MEIIQETSRSKLWFLRLKGSLSAQHNNEIWLTKACPCEISQQRRQEENPKPPTMATLWMVLKSPWIKKCFLPGISENRSFLSGNACWGLRTTVLKASKEKKSRSLRKSQESISQLPKRGRVNKNPRTQWSNAFWKKMSSNLEFRFYYLDSLLSASYFSS